MAPTSRHATAKSEPETKPPALPDLDEYLSKICRDILKLSAESSTILALKRAEITNITILINTDDDVLEQLTYMASGSTSPQKISSGALVQVKGFIRWCQSLRDENDGDLPDDEIICNRDPKEFLSFMRNNSRNPQVLLTPISSTPPLQTKVVDLVADFKKSIKRDASLYPNLKDHRQWNNWKRAVLAQANAHDIQEVFDPEYIPYPGEQERLFQEKNRFAYAVLNKVVLTDEGKSFVRKYEKTFDAQSSFVSYFCLQASQPPLSLARTN